MERRILPYENAISVFRHYKRHFNNMPTSHIASLKTFRRASNGEVAFMRCKGSFPTCDICNTVNNLANFGKNKWSEPELEVIIQFKMNHLAQQNAARDELEEAIIQARKIDKNGQPILVVIYMVMG